MRKTHINRKIRQLERAEKKEEEMMKKINYKVRTHLKYKRKLLGSDKGAGEYGDKFNYNSHAQKDLFDMIHRIAYINKIALDHLLFILAAKAGMPVVMLRLASKGEIALELWELYNLANVSGIKVTYRFPSIVGDNRFSVKTEGVDNEFLVLRCSYGPKFSVTFRKDDLYDFHCDFSDEDYLCYLDTSRRRWQNYYKHFREMCRWYFIRKSHKTTYPFDKEKMKALFMLKFKAGETMHKYAAKHDDATWPYEIPGEEYEKSAYTVQGGYGTGR